SASASEASKRSARFISSSSRTLATVPSRADTRASHVPEKRGDLAQWLRRSPRERKLCGGLCALGAAAAGGGALARHDLDAALLEQLALLLDDLAQVLELVGEDVHLAPAVVLDARHLRDLLAQLLGLVLEARGLGVAELDAARVLLDVALRQRQL